jgi:hypothetical protein
MANVWVGRGAREQRSKKCWMMLMMMRRGSAAPSSLCVPLAGARTQTVGAQRERWMSKWWAGGARERACAVGVLGGDEGFGMMTAAGHHGGAAAHIKP